MVDYSLVFSSGKFFNFNIAVFYKNDYFDELLLMYHLFNPSVFELNIERFPSLDVVLPDC
jgi:hypothetical protein